MKTKRPEQPRHGDPEMDIVYNGAAITDMTRVRRLEVTQYLYDHLDTMTVSFDNKMSLWTEWAPKTGDKIRVTESYGDSGDMYVTGIRPEGDAMILDAAAVKKVHAGHVHSWKDITFKQILKHLADDNGLELKYYDVSDQKYKGAVQSGENDYKFINELCRLEGCVFTVNSGVLNVISNDYIADLPVNDYTFDAATGRYYDNDYYTGCEVTDGNIIGKAGNDSGDVAYLQTKKKLESIGEANRFAANMLEYYNRKCKGGNVMTDSLITELMPGSKIKITCEYWTEHPVVIYRTRHDYLKEKTKFWFYLVK